MGLILLYLIIGTMSQKNSLSFARFVRELFNRIAKPKFTIQGADQVLDYYRGNFVKALVTLFPEIGLDETEFSSLRRMLIIIIICYSPKLFTAHYVR
jgi:hypothetical protein